MNKKFKKKQQEIFTKRYFYRFLVNNKIEIQDSEISFDNTNPDIIEILKLVLNVNIDGGLALFKKYERNIPFTFKIAHKKSDFRNLSLIHPLNQLMVVDFYDTYKDSIRYFANQSELSIRKPFKIAKNRYINSYLQKRTKGKTT